MTILLKNGGILKVKLFEREFVIPTPESSENLLLYLEKAITSQLNKNEIPVRFVVTKTTKESLYCEIGICDIGDHSGLGPIKNLFHLRKRPFIRSDKFNAVMIIPTGINTEIGGHAGDATPVARLLSMVCDNLILHPNIVNASDINEMPENSLYVEGSILTNLIMGNVGLRKVRANKVALLIENCEDPHFVKTQINAASAARASFGMDCTVFLLDKPLDMRAEISSSGRAVGIVYNIDQILKSSKLGSFDAIAVTSKIELSGVNLVDYYHNEMINPWGGVEAILTHAISHILNKPSAHSPMMESCEILTEDLGIVDPRKAAEAVSMTFLHCILKGLNISPAIVTKQSFMGSMDLICAEDISCIIMPDKCIGLPTLAALEQGIPIIAVRENKNNMENDLTWLPFQKGKLYIVDNYLEAVGVMSALKAGIAFETLRRPINKTKVENLLFQNESLL